MSWICLVKNQMTHFIYTFGKLGFSERIVSTKMSHWSLK